MNQRKLILLEFNELCPPLLTRWMNEGRLPNFARFYQQSQVFIAKAEMPAGEDLQPWIQWYSLHTGLSFEQHGVRNLTDGPLADHPDVWSILSAAGLSVMNWGSMNARAINVPGSVFLPDPWCQTEQPFPRELSDYQRVVSTLVQENSSAPAGELSASDLAKFLLFLSRHGLSASTIQKIVGQLLSDAIKPAQKWKRAVLLDRLQFDLFRHYWLKFRPAFSTFFLNSTAHFQHAYWHYAFPEDFDDQPTRVRASNDSGVQDAVLFGYQQMDELLPRFFEFERDGCLLVLTTGLSQQASGRTDRVFYRPRDVRQLLREIGVEYEEVLPVMAEQCSVRFSTEQSAEDARAVLERLTVDGHALFDFGPTNNRCIFFGVGLRRRVSEGALIKGSPSRTDLLFSDAFKELAHTKSATHHPDGALWWKTGIHKVHDMSPSILDVLPTVADYFGVSQSRFDSTGRLGGHSLRNHVGWPPMNSAEGEVIAA